MSLPKDLFLFALKSIEKLTLMTFFLIIFYFVTPKEIFPLISVRS